jgi:hypothetical protein
MIAGHQGALLAVAAMLVPAGAARAQAGAPPPAVEPASPAYSYRPRIVIEIQIGRDFADRSAAALDAGDGLLVSAAGSLTPVWIGNTVGLGFGISFGRKYSSAFSRTPVSAFGQALLQLRDRWFTLVRAGTVKLVSAEGADVDSHWGAFVDGGVCRWFDHQLGVALLVRYTQLTLAYQHADVDAASFGPTIAVFFGD